MSALVSLAFCPYDVALSGVYFLQLHNLKCVFFFFLIAPPILTVCCFLIQEEQTFREWGFYVCARHLIPTLALSEQCYCCAVWVQALEQMLRSQV